MDTLQKKLDYLSDNQVFEIFLKDNHHTAFSKAILIQPMTFWSMLIQPFPFY
jgi:hypothetical protein